MFSLFRGEVEELTGEYSTLLEIPRDPVADLALPCFALAKHFQKAPSEIAVMIAAEINGKMSQLKIKYVKEARSIGPYVNFYINYDEFTPQVLKSIMKKDFGFEKTGEKIIIESPGPNTNKPLHLGHIRNMVLGTSLANILEMNGSKAIKSDIINDRGIHICKSMLAYKKFGKEKLPDKKPDHFVGDYYVLFAKNLEGKPETENEIRQMLLEWENGKKDVVDLWKKMNGWVYEGFEKTYQRLGVHINKTYYESDHYLDGKKIAMEGLKKGVFEKHEEQNIIANLEKNGLGKRVLLRKDGTTVYITQDIALAAKRYKDFRMDRMIYVVGSEQIDHFKALFEIFRLLDYEFASKCYHLVYGMVNLPEGKMKSREGTVVDADDLMDEVHELAAQELSKRSPDLDKKDAQQRAEKIALGAIKFFILKFDAMKTITYDPKISLSFEGDTGPYVMYTYARSASVLRKSKKHPKISHLSEEEMPIIRKLSMFPEVLQKAGAFYNPQAIATYVLELSSMFNEYYHKKKILESEKESELLAMVEAMAIIIKSSLELLGIETLEQM